MVSHIHSKRLARFIRAFLDLLWNSNDPLLAVLDPLNAQLSFFQNNSVDPLPNVFFTGKGSMQEVRVDYN
jgi:hypothetical protein